MCLSTLQQCFQTTNMNSDFHCIRQLISPAKTFNQGILKGTVPLTSCLTGLDWSVLQIKTEIVSNHTADSKLVKQEINGTVILPPLVFPDSTFEAALCLDGTLVEHSNHNPEV